jgi:hypothetical protein
LGVFSRIAEARRFGGAARFSSPRAARERKIEDRVARSVVREMRTGENYKRSIAPIRSNISRFSRGTGIYGKQENESWYLNRLPFLPTRTPPSRFFPAQPALAELFSLFRPSPPLPRRSRTLSPAREPSCKQA